MLTPQHTAWRDAGGHFVLRASGRGPLASSAVSVFEVEQLLLAPDQEQWPRAVLRMFGADAEVQVGQAAPMSATTHSIRNGSITGEMKATAQNPVAPLPWLLS